jgi:trehalose-phosphatase
MRIWPSYKKILAGRPLAIFLDFDGTLAPIAPTPNEAHFLPENQRLLSQLIKHPHCKVAIISGRAIEDLKNKVGLDGIIYVGNHGLEIEGPHIHFQSLMPPQLKKIIDKIRDKLLHQLCSIKGVILEDKGLTLSLHYRLVEEKQLIPLKDKFNKICEPFRKHQEIEITTGKKVLEVRPAIPWHKGHAVSWLLKEHGLAEGQQRVMPLYIGDDMTDEDAFGILKDIGLTVVVGKQPSQAHYYLENVQEVAWFLEQILHLLNSPEGAHDESEALKGKS